MENRKNELDNIKNKISEFKFEEAKEKYLQQPEWFPIMAVIAVIVLATILMIPWRIAANLKLKNIDSSIRIEQEYIVGDDGFTLHERS